MTGRIQTDPAELKRRLDVLRSSTDMHEAAARCGVSNGSNLIAWFARRGVDAKAELMPVRRPDVLARAEREKAERARERTERAHLVKRVVELEAEIEFLHAGPEQAPVIRTPNSRPKSGKRIATPCFLISDTHFGETVTEAESLGSNVYDLEIAAGRLRKCFDNMLWLRADMARTTTCDDTLLVLNGDIVSGDIHAELLETNDGGLRDQCDAAFDAFAPGIVEMAEATPGTLHVVCIGGNHGRMTHKQQIKNGTQHSAEHLGVYDPLRRVLRTGKRGNISWHIPKAERYLFDAHERRIGIQHGTMIRSQGGIGGTLVPMTRWVTRVKDADLYLFGHFHEADAYGRIIKNGSLIGESAYTKWLGVEERPPEQVAFLLDADAGVRRFERVSVFCEADKKRRAARAKGRVFG